MFHAIMEDYQGEDYWLPGRGRKQLGKWDKKSSLWGLDTEYAGQNAWYVYQLCAAPSAYLNKKWKINFIHLGEDSIISA